MRRADTSLVSAFIINFIKIPVIIITSKLFVTPPACCSNCVLPGLLGQAADLALTYLRTTVRRSTRAHGQQDGSTIFISSV
jgi:hypothetical protein